MSTDSTHKTSSSLTIDQRMAQVKRDPKLSAKERQRKLQQLLAQKRMEKQRNKKKDTKAAVNVAAKGMKKVKAKSEGSATQSQGNEGKSTIEILRDRKDLPKG